MKRTRQADIVADIVRSVRADRFGRHTCFVYGEPGTGKSTIGMIVAAELDASFCDEFDPTRPGDKLSMIISEARPSKERPLVILLDEVDLVIRGALEKTIPRHANVGTTVTDKRSWNKFLDKMMHRHRVVLVMTSNSTKASIDNMDDSMLRRGRIHADYAC